MEIQGTGTANNVVQANNIGTNFNATAALGNTKDGVLIDSGAAGNAVELNIVSGNAGNGVEISGIGTANNVAFNNYIGTQKNGTTALANTHDGVLIDGGATGNSIGTTAGGNIVSGNLGNGVEIQGGGTANNVVMHSNIGTDVNGSASLGNALSGVLIDDGATNNTIGDTTFGNVISANKNHGVLIENNGTSGNVVLGNDIGAAANGTAALGNTKDGVLITSGATANTIGGTVSGSGNTIAFNAKGVVVTVNTTVGNSILGNSIFSNKGLGIDLGDNGSTPNGPNPRLLPNDGQNFPVLTFPDTSTITATLTSAAGTYRVEIYASPTNGPAFQGQQLLGVVTITINSGDSSGTASLSGITIPTGMTVTATATNMITGDTSEFS